MLVIVVVSLVLFCVLITSYEPRVLKIIILHAKN